MNLAGYFSGLRLFAQKIDPFPGEGDFGYSPGWTEKLPPAVAIEAEEDKQALRRRDSEAARIVAISLCRTRPHFDCRCLDGKGRCVAASDQTIRAFRIVQDLRKAGKLA